MFKRFGRIVTTFLLVVVIFSYQQGRAEEEAEPPITGGPRRQLAIIIFSGIAGAILGLSTLSFYGRPQDNLQNIGIGAAIGIIGGTVYTTFKAATEPQQYYSLLEAEEALRRRPIPLPPLIKWQFSF